jgi:hypothetical protein
MAEETQIIEREHNGTVILQWPDGSMNGTAMAKANGKQIGHYLANQATKEFLRELSGSIGIPIDLLVQPISTGPNHLRGTRVHKLVAWNLGQWCNPAFAVKVSLWVDGIIGGGATSRPRDPAETAAAVTALMERFTSILSLGGLEERDRLLLKDCGRNWMTIITPGAPTNLLPAPVPVAIVDSAIDLGYSRPRRGVDARLGKAVAAAYRNAHAGQDPPRHEQYVDGRVVRVNSYTTADLSVIDPAIHAFFASSPCN